MTNNIFLYWENKEGSTTPAYIELCRDTIYTYNKKNNIIVIDDSNLSEYISVPDSLYKINEIAHKTDYIRAALLYEHGGIWLDSDCICLKSFCDIFDMLKKYSYVGYYQKTYSNTIYKKHISNGFMAAKKKSKLIKNLHQYILHKINSKNSFDWLELAATAIYPFYLKYKNECHILAQKYISPINYDQWHLFFEDLETSYIPKDSYTVMMFNEMFKRNNVSILQMSKEEILIQKNLLSKLFKIHT